MCLYFHELVPERQILYKIKLLMKYGPNSFSLYLCWLCPFICNACYLFKQLPSSNTKLSRELYYNVMVQETCHLTGRTPDIFTTSKKFVGVLFQNLVSTGKLHFGSFWMLIFIFKANYLNNYRIELFTTAAVITIIR